jgi:alpha-1,6-mannosyltransferase
MTSRGKLTSAVSGLAKGVGGSNLWLGLLGCASLALYLFGLSFGHTTKDKPGIRWFLCVALVQVILYFLATWLILRARPARSTLTTVILFAALFRLSILFAPPQLSDDIYRYIWDGRTQAAGINPYRYVPADTALAPLRDEAIYPNINRRDYARTIYPPVAQAVFLVVTRVRESVTTMKVAFVGFEIITLYALAVLLAAFGLPRQRALIYAWHPLVVWETAGSGHVDALAITFVMLALLARYYQRETAVGVALACAALVKLFPAVLFPALYRRWGWKMPTAFVLTIILAYLPYMGVGFKGAFGFLPGYAEEEGLQSGRGFFILSLAQRVFGGATVPNRAYMIFSLLVLASISAWFLRKQESSPGHYVIRALCLASVFIILLSPRYPWYFTWLVPFLCFAPCVPLFYLTTSCFILYILWLVEKPNPAFAVDAFIYLPFALLCAVTYWKRQPRFRKSRMQAVTE